MIIAVTGASGRIGRATLAELKASGIAEVWALDRSLPPSGLADRSLAQALAAHFQRLIDTSLVVPLPPVP